MAQPHQQRRQPAALNPNPPSRYTLAAPQARHPLVPASLIPPEEPNFEESQSQLPAYMNQSAQQLPADHHQQQRPRVNDTFRPAPGGIPTPLASLPSSETLTQQGQPAATTKMSVSERVMSAIGQLESKLVGNVEQVHTLRDNLHDVRTSLRALPTREELKEELHEIMAPVLVKLDATVAEVAKAAVPQTPPPPKPVHQQDSSTAVLMEHLISSLRPIEELKSAISTISGLPEALQSMTVFHRSIELLHLKVDTLKESKPVYDHRPVYAPTTSNEEILEAVNRLEDRLANFEERLTAAEHRPAHMPLSEEAVATLRSFNSDISYLKNAFPSERLASEAQASAARGQTAAASADLGEGVAQLRQFVDALPQLARGLTSSVERVGTGAGRLENGLLRLEAASNRLRYRADGAGISVDFLRSGADRLAAGVERIDTSVERLGNSVGGLEKGIDRIRLGAVNPTPGRNCHQSEEDAEPEDRQLSAEALLDLGRLEMDGSSPEDINKTPPTLPLKRKTSKASKASRRTGKRKVAKPKEVSVPQAAPPQNSGLPTPEKRAGDGNEEQLTPPPSLDVFGPVVQVAANNHKKRKVFSLNAPSGLEPSRKSTRQRVRPARFGSPSPPPVDTEETTVAPAGTDVSGTSGRRRGEL